MFSAISVTLVVAELIVRVLPESTLGFRFEEGQFKRPRDGRPDKTANKLGFRDIDHGPPQPEVRRLNLLGDSYVHGVYTSVEQSVGRRLEHHLNANAAATDARPDPRPWEVLAFGRGGWGQGDQLDALKRLGRPRAGDVVVTLALTFNDVADNWPRLRSRINEQRRQLAVFRPGQLEFPADKAPGLVFRGSALNRLISHRLYHWTRDAAAEGVPLDYMVYSLEATKMWDRAWQETETLYRRTAEMAAAANASYLVVSASTPHGVWGADEGLKLLQRTYPAMKGQTWDLELPDRRLAEICARLGVAFLRLEPIFRDATAEGRRLHWPNDGHWNPEGNDFAAQRIAEFVLQQTAQSAARPVGQ